MGAKTQLDRRHIRFGVFELDTLTGELRKHGVRVRLQDQPLKLLLCLLETPGEVCTREVLIHRIWPEGTFVDYDRGLNSTATRLRQVIGDSADAPRYVETVGRKGYRFIAPVERTTLPEAGPQVGDRNEGLPSSRQQTAGLAPQEPIQQLKLSRFWPYIVVLAIGLVTGVTIGWWRGTRPRAQPLVRLSVDVEPEMTPTGNGTVLALSPDGSLLVVAVRCEDGKIRLATRRLEQSHITALPGTEGASSPFFSPDGQWIAFFADAKLKKIAVQGGAPVALADASTFARGPYGRFPAGSWGGDGNIIAMLNPTAGLTRVPSTGGPPAPLAGLSKAEGEVDTWPQVLPSSRAVLFTRHKGDYDSANLEIFSFTTGERKTILNGGFFGRYLPDGHLLYIHRNALFAVPFDVRKLTATGAPQQVLEDINSSLTDWGFDFSRTGSFGYVSHQAKPHSSIFWLDSSGKTMPLPMGAESSYASPRFSPDGRRLAFSRSIRGQQDIWVMDLDRGAASRLTALPGVSDAPVWTPDGSTIIFRSVDQPKPGIYGVRADGSGEARRLLELTSGEFPSSVSPDGKRLAIWTIGTGKISAAPVESNGRDISIGKPQLFLQTRLNSTVYGRMFPAFSPDGKWLAYCSNESDQLEVYVVPFPSPGRKWRISTAGGLFPAWSRNGRELLFQDLESHRMMVTTYSASGDSFSFTSPHLWSDTPLLELGLYRSYDLAPDGRRLAIVLYADGTAEWKRVIKVNFLLNFFDELRRRVPIESHGQGLGANP
jgi:serine/threonine-protein kinase